MVRVQSCYGEGGDSCLSIEKGVYYFSKECVWGYCEVIRAVANNPQV